MRGPRPLAAVLLLLGIASAEHAPVLSDADADAALQNFGRSITALKTGTPACKPREFGKAWGGHYLCHTDPDIDEHNCWFVSIGVSYDYSFDTHVALEFNCRGYALDPSVKYPPFLVPGVSFLPLGANSAGFPTDKGWASTSVPAFREWMGRDLYVLKMDCEGCEYSLADDILQHDPDFFTHVNQLNIEMHFPIVFCNSTRTVLALGRLLHLLHAADMALVHVDDGHCGPEVEVEGCHHALTDAGIECLPGCRSFLFVKRSAAAAAALPPKHTILSASLTKAVAVPSVITGKLIVWLLWFQGWQYAPWVAEQVAASWEVQNPDAVVVRLSAANLHRYLNMSDISYIFEPFVSMHDRAAIIRLHLLAAHGGVWADATVLCMGALDWVPEAVAPSGFWAYHGGKDAAYPASFLMIQSQTSTSKIVQRWKAAADAYWRGRREAADAHGWLDGLFRELVRDDLEVRVEWENTPFIDCGAPGQSYMLAGRRAARPLKSESQTLLASKPPYVLKLSLELPAEHMLMVPDGQRRAGGYEAIELAQTPRTLHHEFTVQPPPAPPAPPQSVLTRMFGGKKKGDDDDDDDAPRKRGSIWAFLGKALLFAFAAWGSVMLYHTTRAATLRRK